MIGTTGSILAWGGERRNHRPRMERRTRESSATHGGGTREPSTTHGEENTGIIGHAWRGERESHRPRMKRRTREPSGTHGEGNVGTISQAWSGNMGTIGCAWREERGPLRHAWGGTRLQGSAVFRYADGLRVIVKRSGAGVKLANRQGFPSPPPGARTRIPMARSSHITWTSLIYHPKFPRPKPS